MRCEPNKNIKSLIAVSLFLFFCAGGGLAQKTAVDSQKVETLYAQAADALQNGDLSGARKSANELLKIAPRSSAAHTIAGIVADRDDDLAKAEKHFALAARLAPDSPETRNNYGAILVRRGRQKEAAAQFAASLAINPQQSSALVNLAQIRVSEGNFAQARELFGKAEAIAPDAEVLRALVLISLELDEKERAAREFAEYFAAAKAENGVTPDLALAESLLTNSLSNEARQELEFILSLENRSVGAIVLLSKVYLQQKNIPAAGKLLESAVKSGMDDAKIYLALAEVYEAGGYPENAIPAMRLAIEKEPKNDFYRSRYGLLLVNSKAPAAAIVRLEEALKEFPDSPSLWFALGIAQFDNNKIPEAGSAFEKALALDPQLVPALAYLGAVFVEQARYADAVKSYERAIALDGKTAVLQYLLGDTLLKLTDTDDRRIETALKKSAELDANLTSAHITLGRLYVRQTRWAEAAASLERAAKLEPERAETFYQLGRVYARLKRADESKAVLEKFKQLNDSQKERKETDRRDLVRRLANVRF